METVGKNEYRQEGGLMLIFVTRNQKLKGVQNAYKPQEEKKF